MPQTLLAFLAVIVASIAALNQQTAMISMQEDLIQSELEIMANAVALEVLETQAASLDFDELVIQSETEQETVFQVADLEMPFVTRTSIRYVDEEGTVSVAPTDIKEVEVAVYNERYARPMVVLARMFAD